MRLLLVDNYDSFTYNLYQLLTEASGSNISVLYNDKVDLDAVKHFDKIVFSPGPGIPQEVPVMAEILAAYQHQKSILGVCLGHQAIACFFGAQLVNLPMPLHGISSALQITDSDEKLFQGLHSGILVGRYHSWVVDESDLPDCLKVTSRADDGCIMSFSHKHYDIRGVQFHPESYITKSGLTLMKNWLH